MPSPHMLLGPRFYNIMKIIYLLCISVFLVSCSNDNTTKSKCRMEPNPAGYIPYKEVCGE